ncbi:MAG TPA: sugar ABC transporter permease YjfF, partial [Clostridiales bacterium]|nr:sugar ABC transporter permease YjfF [Clostridiales bacterium]
MACAVNLDYKGGTITSSILLALGIGLAFGLVQGFLVAYLNIQPFIVTLAGLFFA